MRKKLRWSVALFVIFLHGNIFAQDTVLDEYIRTGLKNNLQLQMRKDSLRMSIESLRQAKGMFFPQISLNARYTVAEGGRIIDFPVGDLLNPVYSTLNTLTGTQNFSMVENQSFPFLRPREHETKLRLVQPLFNTDIYYNKKISENFTDIREAGLEAYRHELVAEIRLGYYSYMQAVEIERTLQQTREVLLENLRVNRALLVNEKITREKVLQAEAELAGIDQQLAEVRGMKRSSAAWFNFLLNRDLQAEIIAEEPQEILLAPELETAREQALRGRKELDELEYYRELAGNTLSMNKSSRLPDLVAVVDYGYQGEEYSFTPDDDFMMASLVLSWDIFKGLQKQREVDRSRIQLETIGKKQEETKNLIELEVINAWNELQAASEKIDAAGKKAAASREVFRMVDKKYSKGMSNMLEFTNARRDMTAAETGLIIAKYEYLSRYAAFEKAAGLADLHRYE